MKCIIVDDEEMAVKVIENHISHIKSLEVVGIYYNAMDAFSALQNQEVDLLFLDIQMPKMTGLSLLRTLPHPPQVILTTAFREFALEGYELDIVDYLLKPISFDRFMKAIGKVKKREKENQLLSYSVPEAQQSPAFFYVKSDRQYKKILLDEVLYIESLRNHIKIQTTSGSVITLLGIGEIEKKLPPQHFIRIHRSYITSLSKIQQFSPTQVKVVDKILPIGNQYRKEVFRRLEKDLI